MPHIVEIQDLLAPELAVFSRLSERELQSRGRPEDGLFIAESPNVILRALDAGFEPTALLTEYAHIEKQAKPIIERCGEIPVYVSFPDILTELTGFHLTRGMLCAMRRKPLPDLQSICAGARRIAVLEEIQNPTNVGAIFRSAAALSMDAVLLTPACSDPLYRRSLRVSMGTVFQVPWTILPIHDAKERILTLHALGFHTVAMALCEHSLPIDAPCLASEERLAIFLGTEGAGLTAETIENSDYCVKIPMRSGVDSLNVAAASAVAFWQLRA